MLMLNIYMYIFISIYWNQEFLIAVCSQLFLPCTPCVFAFPMCENIYDAIASLLLQSRCINQSKTKLEEIVQTCGKFSLGLKII